LAGGVKGAQLNAKGFGGAGGGGAAIHGGAFKDSYLLITRAPQAPKAKEALAAVKHPHKLPGPAVFHSDQITMPASFNNKKLESI
jgi:hypothetical protein